MTPCSSARVPGPSSRCPDDGHRPEPGMNDDAVDGWPHVPPTTVSPMTPTGASSRCTADRARRRWGRLRSTLRAVKGAGRRGERRRHPRGRARDLSRTTSAPSRSNGLTLPPGSGRTATGSRGGGVPVLERSPGPDLSHSRTHPPRPRDGCQRPSDGVRQPVTRTRAPGWASPANRPPAPKASTATSC